VSAPKSGASQRPTEIGNQIDFGVASTVIHCRTEAEKLARGLHSEIFPGAYASTTECADYLLNRLALKRHPRLVNAQMGMQQLSAVDAGGFHLRGYAGNSATDHIDFLHAMPAWFGLVRVK